MVGHGLQPVHGVLAQQRSQEQRAARVLPQPLREQDGRVGVGLADHLQRRAVVEAVERDAEDGRGGVDMRRPPAGLGATGSVGPDDQHPVARHPVQEHADGIDRLGICPLHVVDQHDDRAGQLQLIDPLTDAASDAQRVRIAVRQIHAELPNDTQCVGLIVITGGGSQYLYRWKLSSHPPGEGALAVACRARDVEDGRSAAGGRLDGQADCPARPGQGQRIPPPPVEGPLRPRRV